MKEWKWNKRYEELLEYKERFGNCLVPVGAVGYSELAQWVSRQRSIYKKGELFKDREEKLKKVGFVWDLKEQESRQNSSKEWNQDYQFLNVYLLQRQLNLKTTYVIADKELNEWVRKQQDDYKNNKLPSVCVEKLEGIGLIWDRYYKENIQGDAEWNQNYETLILEINQSGGELQDRIFIKNEKLNRWMDQQSQAYKQGILSLDRILKLQEVNVLRD
ncbi:helicase associated domain-containing protein [Priestia filamentosa]|uniref:helicase associated domain-containing protein n=1 Tax=Priestia filamentosa TaxID=1402861 RepID=UPI0039821588